MTLPNAPTVTITARTPPLQVRAFLNEEPAKVVSGYGGWTDVARARRISLTRWTGVAPLRMQIPLWLEGDRPRGSAFPTGTVEPACVTIERMARPPAARTAPPVLRIAGPVPHTTLAWVVDTDGIDWGDALYHSGGYRIRQFVTVTVVEHIHEVVASATATAQARDTSDPLGVAGGVPYTIVAGDTLAKIAARHYGDASRSKDIAKANGIRDPNHLTPGRTITLP